jgi:dTDP-glucose pyrophosphorylase/CBS domain-containing protein
MKPHYVPSWQSLVLHLEASITDAIQILDTSGLKIVLVAKENGNLIGTISDGDIRRALLSGKNISDLVDSTVNRQPIFAQEGASETSIFQLMLKEKIFQIPLIDHLGKLTGLYVLDHTNLHVNRTNVFVIMAGGRGSRLFPQTANTPKALLPIGDKPAMQHILEQARGQGFANFVFSIHYLGDQIIKYFGDGAKFGVKIEYIEEESPLGTAGALSLIKSQPTEPFIVTNCDVLSNMNYSDLIDFHIDKKVDATIAVKSYEWEVPFGVVSTNGWKVISYQEKPKFQSFINAGVYVIQPQVLGSLIRNEVIDMPTLLEKLRFNGGEIAAYPIHESWLDIGTPSDLTRARKSSPLTSEGGTID